MSSKKNDVHPCHKCFYIYILVYSCTRVFPESTLLAIHKKKFVIKKIPGNPVIFRNVFWGIFKMIV